MICLGEGSEESCLKTEKRSIFQDKKKTLAIHVNTYKGGDCCIFYQSCVSQSLELSGEKYHIILCNTRLTGALRTDLFFCSSEMYFPGNVEMG